MSYIEGVAAGEAPTPLVRSCACPVRLSAEEESEKFCGEHLHISTCDLRIGKLPVVDLWDIANVFRPTNSRYPNLAFFIFLICLSVFYPMLDQRTHDHPLVAGISTTGIEPLRGSLFEE